MRIEGIGSGPAGTAYLYVLPCAYEDFAKLGMAKDPLVRMHAFSSRYYEFFDLDGGWIAEASDVREARAWETHWKRKLRAHAAPPPLLVPKHAAGRTEWFRGAMPQLQEAGALLAAQGFMVHRPLKGWVTKRLLERLDYLEAGEQAAVLRFGPADEWPEAPSSNSLAGVRDTLDAYRALRIPLADIISPAMKTWLSRNSLVSDD